ncbi:MAG TPA: RNA polymerase sigma factor [Thermomicrobiales bacterium]|nr:RNA polymerase sigma factor [Thermomicrobiales bacterium]
MAITSASTHALTGEPSDRSLLQGVRRGDERAFEELFLRHYSWLLGVVRRIIGDADEAEEIVQETFLRLYQRPTIVNDDVNARGWLYRVAANTAFNAVRSRNRRARWSLRLARRPETGETSDDPLAIVTAMDEAARVRMCLAGLPERQRHVLVLRAEGHSYAEIANMIDVKPGSVGTILARAEHALRSHVERNRHGLGDRV